MVTGFWLCSVVALVFVLTIPSLRTRRNVIGVCVIGTILFVIMAGNIGRDAAQLQNTASHATLGYSRSSKASLNVVAVTGNLSDEDGQLYGKGIQHVDHRKIGSYTVGQIIDQERSREREAQQAQAAEDAHFFHGEPDCLVLDNRTLGSSGGDYVSYVTGRVTNKCDRDFSYAQVEVNFYSTDGSLANSGLANVNNLQSGSTWAFRVLVPPDVSGGKWRIEKVDGF